VRKNLKTYKKLIQPNQEQIVDTINEILDSVNTASASAETENYKGKPGDIKVNKVGKYKYDFYVKGEDGWHRDTNSSYGPVNNQITQDNVSVMMQNNGTIDNIYKGTSRILLDLDNSTVTGVASPKISLTGNGIFSTTGNTTIDSAGDIELNADGGDLSFKDDASSLASLNSSGLLVNNISSCGTDTDKFLVSDSGTIKFRTGAEVFSDIGAASGDITGVTITTDTGAGSKASDTSGSADFSLLGSNGVGITNSGTTITAVAVPSEIDHDSLNNFASNEHYTQANIVATGALDSGSITSSFGDIDNGSNTIDTTGAVSTGALTCTTIDTGQGANEVYDMDQNVKTDSTVGFAAITAGAVVWQSFPFILSAATFNRYYYLDVDDTANSFRRWDDYDTTPTGINYRDISGQFVVPEDCTLVAMHGVIGNMSSTNNPTIYIYHGTVTEAASDTTLASAGNVNVTVTTLRVPYKFSKEDFDTDLSAGDVVVPMIKHTDSSGTRTFQGSLTLKFITR